MGKALVLRGGALGDFVLTLPTIRLMAEGLPKAEVEVMGYAPMIQLAELAGLAVATKRIEHVGLASFFVPGAELDPEWCAYFESFDVIVSYLSDPHGIFKGNLIRAGVGETDYFPAIAQVSADATHGHAVEQLARPLESIGLFLDDPVPSLNLSGGGMRSGVAIHPGSGSASKNWSRASWKELALELAGNLPAGEEVAVVSGEAEEEWIDEWLADLRGDGVNVASWRMESLTDLAAKLAGVRAFVGHDTGTSHLAAAAGAPTVALFAPTDPAVWRPMGDHVTALRAEDGDWSRLSVADVLAAARERMG
ncbi:glycosyltransferase family 9 protein [Sulfuriroseicoccus oceanibius]|uniref:Glycosyltransferase family 9 protein n=1 Tax=Sulfuriroseicoccus oceanibius TaxID=2707525 RepID=A0A6B3LDU2_9BACT|nr:glycosyltransferase family 9 protein [Sulfuriroseicoccus oceanibius]QQL45723.1 glycosyltransferase family 9 protein [Sulfuriroseicoccus oceanibius]